MLPRIGCPHARPAIVCVATAWKTDAARSVCSAPWFSSGWTSDLAKTPQRDAIGYRWVYSAARSLRPEASVCRSVAIWSMKAPVPPAQVPFIRCSGTGLRYVIFASSPPSSMTTSASGCSRSMTSVAAMTSWKKSTPIMSATWRPPEPVTPAVSSASGKTRRTSSSSCRNSPRTSAWWRR